MKKELLPILLVSAFLHACPENPSPEPQSEVDAGAQGVETGDARTAPEATSVDAANLDTDYKAFQARMDKLRSCGLVSQGEWPFDPALDLRCMSLCLLAADCADLEAELCEGVPVESLEACFDRCDSDEISCGEGESAPEFSACDLVDDCRNGEDEKHCEVFRCETGGQIVGSHYVCDGEADCSDASDEADCALLCGAPRVTGL